MTSPAASDLGAMTIEEWRAYLVTEWARRGLLPEDGDVSVSPDDADTVA